MEAAATLYSSLLPPFPCPRRSPLPQLGLSLRKRSPPACVRALRRDAHGRDFNYDGKLVDEDMIVLRKRIREMEKAERSDMPPSDWMEWEKRYYAHYDSDVCEAMGILQSLLMNRRPSVALGILVLIGLSVPTSAAVILFHLTEMAKGALAGIFS